MIDFRDRRAHPSFILFCTDQQRADFLGCGGHPVLRTPNIDGIARNGVQFARCYVSSPQCMPNRSTMMTGRLPSVHGVRTNGIPLPLRSNTFVDLLRAKGYRTALVGKSHLQNMLDAPPDRLPEELQRRRASCGEYAEAMKPGEREDYERENVRAWRGLGHLSSGKAYYGFEHVDLCTMHGDMVGGDYDRWLRTRRFDVDRLRGRHNQLPHDYVCPQAWRTAMPEELYPTRYIQDHAVEWLSSYETRRNNRPFFLMVSFPDPHHPFTPPGKYWDLYDPVDMPVPRTLQSDAVTPFLRYTRDHSRGPGANEYHAMAVSAREAQEAAALTCGMVAMIDDAVGAVLKALDDAGLREETVVAFTSDHGDLMGDHGMLLKGPFHYQGLIRVPMLWSEPEGTRFGERECDALVGTIDLAPTILDRAHVQPFHGMQGRSMRSLMTDADAERRTCFLVEEEQHDGVLGHRGALRAHTLVTDRFRLSLYSGEKWGEIYDLVEDPDEERNLWDEPGAALLKSDLITALAHEQIDGVDPSPFPYRLG